jgi:hypothetical protein
VSQERFMNVHVPGERPSWDRLAIDWIDVIAVMTAFYGLFFLAQLLDKIGAHIPLSIRLWGVIGGSLVGIPMARRRLFRMPVRAVEKRVTILGLLGTAVIWIGMATAGSGILMLVLLSQPVDPSSLLSRTPEARQRELDYREANNREGLVWTPVIGLIGMAMIYAGSRLDRPR